MNAMQESFMKGFDKESGLGSAILKGVGRGVASLGASLAKGGKGLGMGAAGLGFNMLGSEVADRFLEKKPQVNKVYVHPGAFKQMQSAQAGGADPKEILGRYMNASTQQQPKLLSPAMMKGTGAPWLNVKAAFEKGFLEEFYKQAGWMGALGKAVGTVAAPLLEGGGRSLMNNLGRAASRIGPAAGGFATQYPRAAKFMRFGAGQAVQGAAFSAAMAPFARRQQVTQVLPYEDQQKAAAAVTAAFRSELKKLGFPGEILGKIGPALEGAAAKLTKSRVVKPTSKALSTYFNPVKKTFWNHPMTKEMISGAKWGLGVGAATRALTKDDEPEVKIG